MINFTPLKSGSAPAPTTNGIKFTPLNQKSDNNSFPKQEPDHVKQSFMQRLGHNLVDPIKTGINEVANDTSQAFTGGINQIKEGFQQTGDTSPDPRNLAEGALKIGAGAVNTSFSPLATIFKPVGEGVNYVADKISNSKGVQDFAQSNAGKATSRVAEDVGNLSTIAQGAAGFMESPKIIDTMKTGLDTVAETAKPIIKKVDSVGQQGLDAIKTKGDALQDTKATKQFNTTTGKIIQGTTQDISKAQKSLSNIDISKVENAPKGQKYQALGQALKDKIDEVKSTQQKAFDTRPEKIHFQDLTTKGHNFVNDAINQLQDYYQKTNNIDKLNNINALKSEAETQGLSPRQVDDLAVQHGSELSGYNANGELASGLTKQAAENTRQGLKDTVRQYMGNKVFENSDMQISDLIRTKDLVDQVAEKANALGQKIQQRGLLGKIGYYTGKAVDLASGGALKNFVNYFIPRGEGLKTLNALDLEKGLQGNLKLLQDLDNGTLSDADFTTKLNEVIKKGNPQKLLPEPAKGSIRNQNNTPINQPSKVITNSADQSNIKGSKVTTPNIKYKRGGGKITQIFGEPR